MEDFNPDTYLHNRETPTTTMEGFDPDKYLASQPKSIGGAFENLGKDALEQAKGFGGSLAHSMGEFATKGLIPAAINTGINVAKSAPGALLNEGKRLDRKSVV